MKQATGEKKRAISTYNETGKEDAKLARIRGDAGLINHHACQKLKASGIKQDSLLLDVGCGEGLDMIGFARTGMKIIGVDISSVMLEACRRAHSENGLEMPDIITGDAENLPFMDEAFEMVHSRDLSSFNILYVGGASATSDPLVVLREMKRICKIKGKILTMLPIHDGPGCDFKPSYEEEIKYMYRHTQITFLKSIYLRSSSKSRSLVSLRMIPFLREREARSSDFIVGIGQKD